MHIPRFANRNLHYGPGPVVPLPSTYRRAMIIPADTSSNSASNNNTLDGSKAAQMAMTDPEDQTAVKYVGLTFIVILLLVLAGLWIHFTKAPKLLRRWFLKTTGKQSQGIHIEHEINQAATASRENLPPGWHTVEVLPYVRVSQSPPIVLPPAPPPPKSQRDSAHFASAESLELGKMSKQGSAGSSQMMLSGGRSLGEGGTPSPTFEQSVMLALPRTNSSLQH